MRFTVIDKNENVYNVTRRIGYKPLGFNDNEEYNIVRLLDSSGYPRFHIYIKISKKDGSFSFNLHLDQKKPSYSGSTAHSGEYDGELVEQESERIKSILESQNNVN